VVKECRGAGGGHRGKGKDSWSRILNTKQICEGNEGPSLRAACFVSPCFWKCFAYWCQTSMPADAIYVPRPFGKAWHPFRASSHCGPCKLQFQAACSFVIHHLVNHTTDLVAGFILFPFGPICAYQNPLHIPHSEYHVSANAAGSKPASPIMPGFDFSNYNRNAALHARGVPLPKATSTGTTIVGCIFDNGVVVSFYDARPDSQPRN
jgi:hypothetical protein